MVIYGKKVRSNLQDPTFPVTALVEDSTAVYGKKYKKGGACEKL